MYSEQNTVLLPKPRTSNITIFVSSLTLDTLKSVGGGVIILLGILLILLPSLLILVINDAGFPPVTVFSISFGLVLGLPLIGIGYNLVIGIKRFTLYLLLIAVSVLMTIGGFILQLYLGTGG